MKFFPISVKFTSACAGISRLVSPSSLGLGPLIRVVRLALAYFQNPAFIPIFAVCTGTSGKRFLFLVSSAS